MEFKCNKCGVIYTSNADIPKFKCVCGGERFKKIED